MKKKIVWPGVIWLIVAASMLASCGPAVTEEEEVVEEVVEEEREVIPVNSDEVPCLCLGQTALIIAAEIPKLDLTEAVQMGELEVTVSDAILTDSYEYYAEFAATMITKEAPPGMTFLIADVKIKNVGKELERFQGAKRMHACDSGGNVCEVGVYYGENNLEAGRFPEPGDELSGKVLFEIPEAASDVRIFYDYFFPEVKLVEWEIE